MTFGARGTAGLTTVGSRSIESAETLRASSSQALMLGSCGSGTFSPAVTARAGGWGRCTLQHILAEESKGQDVVLGVLELFVNRWGHVLAIVTSLSPPQTQGGGKRVQWKALNIQWHEGHQDRKSQVFIFLFLNDQSSSKNNGGWCVYACVWSLTVSCVSRETTNRFALERSRCFSS